MVFERPRPMFLGCFKVKSRQEGLCNPSQEEAESPLIWRDNEAVVFIVFRRWNNRPEARGAYFDIEVTASCCLVAVSGGRGIFSWVAGPNYSKT